MAQNENAVTALFTSAMQTWCPPDAIFGTFPTGGADRQWLADMILARSGAACLVEMKYDVSDLASELRTKKRANLLLSALSVPESDWHEHGHFASWSEASGPQRDVFVGVYAAALRSQGGAKWRAQQFADQFFGGQLGLDFETFDRYSMWLAGLYKTTGEEAGKACLMLSTQAGSAIVFDNPLDLLESWQATRGPPRSRPLRGEKR